MFSSIFGNFLFLIAAKNFYEICLLTASYNAYNPSAKEDFKKYRMKYQIKKPIILLVTIFSFFSMISFSQNPIKNYEKEWKKVEDFVSKGLPKSALTEVKLIYALAKKEKQDAQVIKSLVYMMGLQSENREENAVFSITEIEKEISSSKEPVTSILSSLEADMYWNYYQQNRWKLYNRTKTADFVKTDIAT